MEYIVTYDKDGSRHVAHVTNAADRNTARKMVELTTGGTIAVISVEVATITVPNLSR